MFFCFVSSIILLSSSFTLTKNSLQVLYNPRRLNGYGLLDGELVERLWSYMRPFPKITKEMTLSHRQDLLADAFAHFSRGKSHNIGKYICIDKKQIIVWFTLFMCCSSLTHLCSLIDHSAILKRIRIERCFASFPRIFECAQW